MRSSLRGSGQRSVILMFEGKSQISDLKLKYESWRSSLWNFCFTEFISSCSPESRSSFAYRFVACIDEKDNV
jgi:hypothetical protein